jgi:hypothetical protein
MICEAEKSREKRENIEGTKKRRHVVLQGWFVLSTALLSYEDMLGRV